MGCTASTHGGLYHIPIDEGDTSYVIEDNSIDDGVPRGSRKQQRHRQSRQRQGGNAKRKQGKASSSSSKSTSQKQQSCCPQDVDPPCVSLCQNKVVNSPERRPLPPSNNPISNTMTQHRQLNESINSIIDHDITTDCDEHHAFSNRRWLVLPEQQYDMSTMHPSLPPFLGSMYWTAASPLPTTSQQQVRRGRLPVPGSNDKRGDNFPSLISPSTTLADSPMETCPREPRTSSSNNNTPFTRFGIQGGGVDKSLIPSLNSTQDWESDATSVSSDTHDDDDDDDENGDCFININTEEEASCMSAGNTFSPRKSVDISRELLDYSHLEESFILESKRSHQPPRRLFDDQDVQDNCNNEHVRMMEVLDESFEVVAAPSRQCQGQQRNQKTKSHTKQSRTGRKLSSLLCMAPLTPSWTATECTSTSTTNDDCNNGANVAQNHGETSTSISRAVSISPHIMSSCPSSPNVATFYGHWGSRRERHVSTLPSPNSGEPIRLRVTDKCGNVSCTSSSNSRIGQTLSNSNSTSYSSPGDCFSYDPYFSSGKYTITLPNGHAYGNGLVMKMGYGQFMILEDSRGVVLAVIKSRYTHTPSMVVYATKRRFGGQIASGHQLTRQTKGHKKNVAVVVDGNGQHGGMMGNDYGGEALYPWALISKGGRTMGDDCTIHLVNGEVKGLSSLKGTTTTSTRRRANSSSSFGMFHSKPSFRGRHGFDQELHTHTVVSRTLSSTSLASSTSIANKDFKSGGKSNNHSNNGNTVSTSLEEVPCCVIVRDPSNLDAVDITIAPGIDPLLMICYLASHSKMDVEPIMIGY
mmetsp:Transcript_25627/g.55128  ORF Transcript_25627/g.55128 Transcript_25627/m.55128 type:complete len:807 (-) Transcript_25627:82-2502(-)|eukprot:CAMPEP_0172316000 /NCGR_PEP_ID=MMETSP1058-20130122/26929_1 /TAXON_ID=83371 /ORGANISM="Detonula confervacea, Strain CCMP 353" /LENGTH=806 /DNA_ID=CAMNT_0013030217 /DNA_START=76 /DNA_END=2496 /DNA_ORIENTATION=-